MNHRLFSFASIATAAGALALFFLLAVLYFAPQLGGETLLQHDVRQYEGMSKDIADNREATGEDAQWTGRMFGGMPAYLIDVKYPAQAVKGTLGKTVKIIDTPASFLFFAMAAMWVAMLLFGFGPWAALVGAVAYGFSTYFILIIGAGHVTKMWAAVYAPPMMAGIYCTLRRGMWTGAAVTALFASLEIGANHPQITYYFVIAAAALWISECVYALRGRRMRDFAKRTAALAAAAVLAVGSNFAPLWYTWRHTKITTRGGSELAAAGDTGAAGGLDLEYATAWSYGRAESLNMLVPDFMGGSSADSFADDGPVAAALKPYGLDRVAQMLPRYRGDQPYTAGPTYLGAAAVMLALMALLLLPDRERWWIAGAMLLTLLMAWGNHLMWFTELLFRWLPGYNRFRTLSMALVVVQWAVPMLAAAGVARMIGGTADKARAMRALKWAAGICAGVLLVMVAGGRSLGDFGMQQSGQMLTEQFRQMLQQQDGGEQYIRQGLHEQMGWAAASAMAEERAGAMRGDALRSLAFVLLAAAAVWLWLKGRVITRPAALCAVLTAITAADLIAVDTRYLAWDDFVTERSARITPTEADKFIMQDKDPAYRVLNLAVSPFNDATTSYFHRSAGGYHGAKLARYQDMIDRYMSRLDEGVLDMLNVRYVIGPSATAEDVERRGSANGAAWMVGSVVRASSPEEEIELTGRIDSKSEAVMADGFLPDSYSFAPGTITLEEYRPNYLRYRYEAEGDALAVFSEIYTPDGWTATVDGEPARPLRADYILRALELPAGSHTVEWRYRAPHWTLVEGITLAFSLATLAAFALTLIYRIRNERRQKTQA